MSSEITIVEADLVGWSGRQQSGVRYHKRTANLPESEIGCMYE
ncbi:MAG: hypothetical protein ABW185_28495 [Sedimenticola sp.]